MLQTSSAQHGGPLGSKNLYSRIPHFDRGFAFQQPCRRDWDIRAGNVDWMPHLPQLLTHIQWSFQVPVGGATAQSPIGEGLRIPCSPIVVQECFADACRTLRGNPCPDSLFCAAILSEAVQNLQCCPAMCSALHRGFDAGRSTGHVQDPMTRHQRYMKLWQDHCLNQPGWMQSSCPAGAAAIQQSPLTSSRVLTIEPC